MKALWIFLSGFLGTLFALQQIGGIPIAPGHSTKFSLKASNARGLQTWRLRTDDADLRCWVRLRVRPPAIPGEVWAAVLGDRDTLAVMLRPDSAGSSWLEVSRRDSSGRLRVKFEWSSGTELVLTATAPMLTGPRVIDDWEVYSATNESDSRSKADRRRALFWGSLLVLLASLLSGVAGALWRKPVTHKPMTAEWILLELIAKIEGKTSEDTEHMQSILRKVLVEHAQVAVALDSIGLDFFRSRKLFRDASTDFFSRFDSLVTDLNTYHIRLHRIVP